MERDGQDDTGQDNTGDVAFGASVAASASDLFGGAPAARRIPLTGSPLDRADHLRRKLEARMTLVEAPEARAMALWNGKIAVTFGPMGPELVWAPLVEFDGVDDPKERPFLGLLDGAARLVCDISDLDEEMAGLWMVRAGVAGGQFVDLRSIGPDLSPGESAIIAEARALVEWSRAHRSCSRCGAPTEQSQGGWRRDCPSCGGQHFPRTDPVVIMLCVHRDADGVERVLLGRQPQFPPRMHSLLAGFVEPGESIEEAARREVMEEAGVPVGHVSYIASQPWPFPSTLMMGVYAEALSLDLTIDYDELETALWVTRDDMKLASEGAHPDLAWPRADAIARTLVDAWVRGDLDPKT